VTKAQLCSQTAVREVLGESLKSDWSFMGNRQTFSERRGNTPECHLHGTTTVFLNTHFIRFLFRANPANIHCHACLPSIMQCICMKEILISKEKVSI